MTLFLVLPFGLLNWWAGTSLFRKVSYSNSVSLDATLRAWNSRNDWAIVAVGDSEVRWGIDPSQINKEFKAIDVAAPAFNFGIDGFSSALNQCVVPHLPLDKAPTLKVALIGVQMIENHRLSTLKEISAGGFGDLHRPVFQSAFARDRDLDMAISEPHWTTPLVRTVENVTPVLRYRKQVRHWLLGKIAKAEVIPFQSTGLPYRDDGYQPHQSINENRANYEQGWVRVLEESRKPDAAYAPLSEDVWKQALAPNGYFDTWVDYFKSKGIQPVLFALPTNPALIDIKNRRQSYLNNSRELAAWAERRDLDFIDLGIQDQLAHDVDYSDHRHLSIYGAEKYSKALAIELAQRPRVVAALRR